MKIDTAFVDEETGNTKITGELTEKETALVVNFGLAALMSMGLMHLAPSLKTKTLEEMPIPNEDTTPRH